MMYRGLKRTLFAVLIMNCLMSLACTLGPKVRTVWVVVIPGQPGQILSREKATMKLLGGDEAVVEQDITGWVAMPYEHWQVIRRKLETE